MGEPLCVAAKQISTRMLATDIVEHNIYFELWWALDWYSSVFRLVISNIQINLLGGD